VADNDLPSATAVQALVTHFLTVAAGGSQAKWRNLIGEVIVLPLARHPEGNWRVSPIGTAEERDAIERAAAIVAASHPYARK
jgi:hypothetical protein